MGERARAGIEQAIRIADVPFSVSGAGSMFRVHVKPSPPQDYRASFLDETESATLDALVQRLFDNGVMLINTCTGALSTAMIEREVDTFLEIFLNTLRQTGHCR